MLETKILDTVVVRPAVEVRSVYFFGIVRFLVR